MNKQDTTQNIEKDTKVKIINAVKTPLSFFVLVVLISDGIIGISAYKINGSDRTFLLVVAAVILILVVLIVAVMAYFTLRRFKELLHSP